ncbi:hypothetical protein [Pseudoduganella sp. R-43]|uniref:hypothetical protein n=1 Tax=Pseudoduganella sp. R-43 TaxID=3404063 RepID=UPI003CE89448
MNLGNAFPPEYLRKQIEQCLVPGAVLYLEVRFPEVTKNKFLVLVATPNDGDDDCFNFIVNSAVNPYITHRQELSVCQVTMDVANHDFLAYDSHIACNEILSISKREIVGALMNDFGRYKGKISVDVKDNILAAVKHAVTLDKIQKREIIAGLEAQYPLDFDH